MQQGMSEADLNGAQAKAQLGVAIGKAQAGEIRRYAKIATGRDEDLNLDYQLTYQGVQRIGRNDRHIFEILETGPGRHRFFKFSDGNYDRRDIQDLMDNADWDFAGVPKPSAPTPISPRSPGAMTDEDMAVIWVKTKDRIAKELGINPKGATKELDDRTFKAIAEETGYKPVDVKAKLDAYRGSGKKLSVLKKRVLKQDPKTKPVRPDLPGPRKVPTKPTPKVIDDVVDKTKKDIADDPGPVYVEDQPGYSLFTEMETELERLRGVNFRKVNIRLQAGPRSGQTVQVTRQYGNVNCVSCTMSWELRMRGLQVRALQDLRRYQKFPEYYKKVFGNEWESINTFKVSPRTGKYQYSNDWKAEYAKTVPNGARGFITVVHKGGGHIFNWEKKNGRLYFTDAQISMEATTSPAILSPRRITDAFIKMSRVDNLPTPPASEMDGVWVEVQK